MKHYSFFTTDTGLFIDTRYATNVPESVKDNTPAGCCAIEGQFDHLSQRVDLFALRVLAGLNPETDADRIAELQSRVVYDYQPPQPDDDHEWSSKNKRWLIKPEIEKKRRVIADAQAEIDRMERLQHRAMRELAINRGSDEALRRLQSIDDQIALQQQLIRLNQ